MVLPKLPAIIIHHHSQSSSSYQCAVSYISYALSFSLTTAGVYRLDPLLLAEALVSVSVIITYRTSGQKCVTKIQLVEKVETISQKR